MAHYSSLLTFFVLHGAYDVCSERLTLVRRHPDGGIECRQRLDARFGGSGIVLLGSPHDVAGEMILGYDREGKDR